MSLFRGIRAFYCGLRCSSDKRPVAGIEFRAASAKCVVKRFKEVFSVFKDLEWQSINS